jgi:glycosyltransferase involved in cell wall biosynthesis
MKKIFCFIDRQEHMEGDLKSYIEELDVQGHKIYIYSDIDDQLNDPGIIISEIDKVLTMDNKDSLVFLTNMENLCLILYRLYHQTFNQFIYYRQADTRVYNLQGIYQKLLLLPVSEAEALKKPICTNAAKLILGNKDCYTKNCQLIPEEDVLTEMDSIQKVRKYYLIDGIYYLFEPVITDKKIVICERTDEDCRFKFPGFANMHYMINSDSELLNEIFACMDNLSGEKVMKLYEVFDILSDQMRSYSYIMYSMTCNVIDDAAQLDDMKDIIRSVALYSFLMKITKSPCYFNRLLEITIENVYLDCLNKYYIFNQCKRYLFTNEVGTDGKSYQLMSNLYVTAFEGFKNEYAGDLVPVPREERNEDTVIIFSIQFLGERHPPTKTTLERCYTLGKLLNKKIILISTREQHSEAGALIVYNASLGNVLEEYNEWNTYQYKDLAIPFYQPSVTMPDKAVIREILQEVRRIKPYYIISIGNGSITADLCGQIVPEIASAVVFSSLPTTTGTFSLIGRSISETEWEQLLRKGYARENIIESTFTFELRPKTRTTTRNSLSIPDDCFLFVTVGNRLDIDVTDEFVEIIQSSFDWGTHIVFAGMFPNYNDFCSKYPQFKEHSTYLGYYDDILSLMEICDLYVNPIRSGGGFSIVEAFHEGKPGVTVRVGDVATAAGEEFCVKDYNEMQTQIKRYIDDREYYDQMAVKARKREKILTDSKAAMEQILEKVQNSRLFF